jgi:hypothetical protein
VRIERKRHDTNLEKFGRRDVDLLESREQATVGSKDRVDLMIWKTHNAGKEMRGEEREEEWELGEDRGVTRKMKGDEQSKRCEQQNFHLWRVNKHWSLGTQGRQG